LAPWAFLSRPFGASFATETSLVVCHGSVFEDIIRPVDGLVRMLGSHLLIEFHAKPGAIGQLGETTFDLHGVPGE
jgi:hypothetical protein